jgi:hypothetical protein
MSFKGRALFVEAGDLGFDLQTPFRQPFTIRKLAAQ